MNVGALGSSVPQVGEHGHVSVHHRLPRTVSQSQHQYQRPSIRSIACNLAAVPSPEWTGLARTSTTRYE